MKIHSEKNTYEISKSGRVKNVSTDCEIPKNTKTFRRIVRFIKGDRTPELQRRFKEEEICA